MGTSGRQEIRHISPLGRGSKKSLLPTAVKSGKKKYEYM